MPYKPGDNWCICDLSGFKVLQSETVKTWDGLRVWKPLYYRKHPQLSLRGIPEINMAVKDARPRPADVDGNPRWGWGAFCLISPNETAYTVGPDDDGALLVRADLWGTPLPVFHVGQYEFTVDNDGALHVSDLGIVKGITPWKFYSADNNVGYYLTVDAGDLAVHLTPI